MIHLYVHKLFHQHEKKCPGTFFVTSQSPNQPQASYSVKVLCSRLDKHSGAQRTTLQEVNFFTFMMLSL